MPRYFKWYLLFALVVLGFSLLLGFLAGLSFLQTPLLKSLLPFQHARPLHVSGAVFWILSGGVGGVVFYISQIYKNAILASYTLRLFIFTWMGSFLCMVSSYFLGYFGGREYWEFPPAINLLILVSWLFYLITLWRYYSIDRKNPPVYQYMWLTGGLFFLFTFLEQNLWQIPWFRENFIREMTIQWKSNGSLVGAWNQMIYGTAIYLMVQLSGDASIARSRAAFFSYFLGLTNLIFNWGHHIYNVPTAGWIRFVSYGISMTEWILVISIIQGFKAKMKQFAELKHSIVFRFLIGAEGWVFLNLILALLMSIPAINRYTHGTHITVAHAMGTTIGINTLILLGSFSYLLNWDQQVSEKGKKTFIIVNRLLHVFLLLFWLSLIAAGVMKALGYNQDTQSDFASIMKQVEPFLYIFVGAGFLLVLCFGWILIQLLKLLLSKERQ